MSLLLDKPFLFSQLLSAFLCCYFLLKKREKTFFLKMLSIFLITTFFVELLGAYLSYIKKGNFLVYHFYVLFQYIIILFLYQGLLKDKKYLKISYIVFFFLIIIWVLTFFNKDYFFYTSILGSFNVGFIVFLYLRELLMSNKIINYKKQLPFWVSIGLLVYHLSVIPFLSFWIYMKDRSLFHVLNSLIIIMNILISFGLIWSNKKDEED